MNVLWMLIYFLRRYPAYVFLFFLNEILLALPSYVGNVLFLKYLMQAVAEKEPVSQMLLLLGATAAFLIASDAYAAWFSGRYRPCEEERIQKDFYGRIRDAAAGQGLEVYDNPIFYDDMTYIDANIAKDSLALLGLIGRMAAGLVNILLIIRLFYRMGLTVLLFAVAAVGISVGFDVPVARLRNRKKYATSGIERKRRYFRDCFFMRETFPERKETCIKDLLYTRHEESVQEQISCERKFGGRVFLLCSLKELLSAQLLMQLLLIAYLLYQTLEARTLQGSDFIAAYNGVNVIMNTVLSVMRSFGEMAPCSYTVRKYRNFLSSVPGEEAFNPGRERFRGSSPLGENLGGPERKRLRGSGPQGKDPGGPERERFRGSGPLGENLGSPKQEEIRSIEFRNVSFSYAGTGKRVLEKVSFRICSGEKIAIVGKNGSGKTTLVHLLMGLYVPTEGEILVNGSPLGREEIPFYRSRFAAFFQGMKPMEATAAENVALDTETDPERLSAALGKAGCEALFPEPEKVMVGVRFQPSGRILSGGECQKLMLAHCFYSDKPMLVLDEPSSALDPAAERAFNRQVAELSGEKTAVFVTHRLSTVHMADIIYVLEDGRLRERGSHEELVKKDGLYQKMWRIQLEKYADR